MASYKALPGGKRVELKRVVSWTGSALMIVSLGFVINRLRSYGMDLSLLTSPWVVAGLMAVVLVEGLGIIAASLNYRAIIKNVSGIVAARPLSVMVYNAANMYKYIPGSIMYFVGRNRLAVETEGLSHGKVAFATVLEGILAVMGALIVALTLSFDHSVHYIRQLTFSPVFTTIFLGGLLTFGTVIFVFRKKIAGEAKNFFSTVEILRPLVIIKRLSFALCLMFLFGLSFAAVLALLGQSMTLSLVLTTVGLYLLGWLAGFLTPGAPSGLGIREAVLLMLMPGVIDQSILLSALLIHRISTVSGDVLALCIAVAYERASVASPSRD